jgi:hypothetical protein
MTKKKGCVPVRVTVVVMKHHDQKQLREERVYLAYTSTALFIIAESQGKNLEAGADAEAAEEWLPPYSLLSLLSYGYQEPSGGSTHSGLGAHPSITN